MPDPRRLPHGARQAFEQGFQAAEISETFWEESFARLVPNLKRICATSRQEEIAVEPRFLGDSALKFKDPKDRARYMLQQKRK